ncbi:MAG TPA: hypothetical protein VM144_00710 [Aestuariivirga sp.]|nr:hypothetical protein [Aestuariivirga sp.]
MTLSGALLLITALGLAFAPPAQAHVKWFAPYIVQAEPQSVFITLADPWFWLGLVLVSIFLLLTRYVERLPLGDTVMDAMDRISDPLWNRLDDFIRAMIAAFFVAIFAVGGVYLTPDLKTPSEWVSWAQLLIAAGIFSKRTMPFSAAGIIGLWLLALRDYDLFHLLDYLALGVGVAAYLVLASSQREDWRAHRFEVLRWAVAIALMWSSLEKFAYPDWFYPLVEERPYLTFGIPRDAFIPMAGVSEFALGFGLLATPLMRRLSALGLLLIFTTAVYPFGRIDLIGHALIMMIIVAIAVDHTRDLHFLNAIRRKTVLLPVSLAGFMAVFAVSYWGTHAAIYGGGAAQGTTAPLSTHTQDPEHPHPTAE